MCSIVASNTLITEEARIAVRQVDEQPGEAARRDLAYTVAQTLVADAAQRLDLLVGLLVDHLDDVVDGDDADQPLVLVDHRRRHQVVAAELAGDLGLIGGREHHRPLLVHDVFDLDVPLAAQQPRDIDRAQHLEGRIDDEQLGERLRQIIGRRIAHRVDDVADGPVGRGGDEIRLHQAAGGVFRIVEVALDRGAIHGRQPGKDLLLVGGVEILDEVGGVVGVERIDRARQQLVRQRLGELVADARIDLRQHLEIEARAERFDKPHPLIGRQQLDHVGEVRRRHAGDDRYRPRDFVLAQRVRNLTRPRLDDVAVAGCLTGRGFAHAQTCPCGAIAPDLVPSRRLRKWLGE